MGKHDPLRSTIVRLRAPHGRVDERIRVPYPLPEVIVYGGRVYIHRRSASAHPQGEHDPRYTEADGTFKA